MVGVEADRPVSGLPARRALPGRSMPWSAQLRTMWVSGSLISSRTWRSSSVSAPCMRRSIFLPSLRARSRTSRGSLAQALPIGCMRVFITLPAARGDVGQALQGAAKALCRPGSGDLQELIAGQHQLADQRHQRFQRLDGDTDGLGTAGGRPRAPPPPSAAAGACDRRQAGRRHRQWCSGSPRRARRPRRRRRRPQPRIAWTSSIGDAAVIAVRIVAPGLDRDDQFQRQARRAAMPRPAPPAAIAASSIAAPHRRRPVRPTFPPARQGC